MGGHSSELEDMCLIERNLGSASVSSVANSTMLGKSPSILVSSPGHGHNRIVGLKWGVMQHLTQCLHTDTRSAWWSLAVVTGAAEGFSPKRERSTVLKGPCSWKGLALPVAASEPSHCLHRGRQDSRHFLRPCVGARSSSLGVVSC